MSSIAKIQGCLLLASKEASPRERRRHLRRLACQLRLLRESRRRKEHPLTSAPDSSLRIGGGVARLLLGPGAAKYMPEKPCPRGHWAPRYHSNNACTECLRERTRARYQQHPEVERERSRQYLREHPEVNRRQSERWAEVNLAWSLAYRANRRARKYGVSDELTREDVEFILDRDGQCLCCGTNETLGVDHVLAMGVGGSNVRSNLQTLCRDCNRRKYVRHVDYRMQEVPMT